MLESQRLILRPLIPEDAPALCDLMVNNRSFLKPWMPASTDESYTLEFQTADIAWRAEQWEHDRAYCFGIFLKSSSALIGRINISQVVRGSFLNCFLGYWLDQTHNGHGLMSEAVRTICPFVFEELALHRIEATTLPHNYGSQRVLAQAGFRDEGLALNYLQIDGHWQDHKRFALTREDWGSWRQKQL